MSVVNLVKDAVSAMPERQLELLRTAYMQNTSHTIRSVKFYLGETLNGLEQFGSISETLFRWLFPERCLHLTCPCGTSLKFYNKVRGYGLYCSSRCSGASETVKTGRIRTVLEKYGVEHVLQAEVVKQKVFDTNLERYGNICSAQGPVQAAIRVPKLRENGIATAAKSAVTVKERYGVESAIHLPQLKAARKTAEFVKWKEVKLPAAIQALSEQDQVECITPPEKPLGTGIWQHHCGTRFSAPTYYAGKCPACHDAARSIPERKLLDFVRTLVPLVLSGDRETIAPLELDIYVPSHKLAIEHNGIYWHRDTAEVTDLLTKTKLTQELGIQLLHFWDYEWIHQRPIVKSMIRGALGLITDVRNAETLTIDPNVKCAEAVRFCKQNHLDGYSPAKLKVGLRDQGELICLLTAGKSRSNPRFELEVIRFCTKIDTLVPGAFAKLLPALGSASIISTADLRFSVNEDYQELGFSVLEQSPPNYVWAKGEQVLSIHRTRKQELPKLLKHFDESLTGPQNLRKNGWLKHADCGSLVFARK